MMDKMQQRCQEKKYLSQNTMVNGTSKKPDTSLESELMVKPDGYRSLSCRELITCLPANGGRISDAGRARPVFFTLNGSLPVVQTLGSDV